MMLKNFNPRLYQETILGTCSLYNTLVVLPTGLGKTGISLMLTTQRLKQYPNSKILILAPTRPLLDQHFNTFLTHLDIGEDKLCVLSGATSPDKRKMLWEDKQIFFATPQTVDNDLISGRISLDKVSLLCLDECQHATGEYAYVYIANQYTKRSKFPKILGLTASPGSDVEKINEVILNLGIERIEIRSEEDKDVAPYVQEVKVEYVGVDFPKDLELIHKNLKACFKSKLESIKSNGYIDKIENRNKRDILQLQAVLRSQISMGDRSMELMRSISLAAEALKVEHAIELIETQGAHALHLYMEDVFAKAGTSKVKANQNLVKDPYFMRSYQLSKRFLQYKHPKIDKLKEILKEQLLTDTQNEPLDPFTKVIIFSHYRDTAQHILESISDLDFLKSATFFGQSRKKGKSMSQKKQGETLDEFREGKYNTLIMTSVGEEGLDIPQVDLVIFFEPVPSAIRTVQRRGRTGRNREGKVCVLYTKGTRDEAYRWSSFHKERRMKTNIKKLAASLNLIPTRERPRTNLQSEQSLLQFIKEEDGSIESETNPSIKHKVFADTREKSSSIIRTLAENEILVELIPLTAGDYVLSKEIGVEFKTVKDFVDSIVDGRLLDQLKKLKEHYQSPLIVIEGKENMFSIRNIHPNAVMGMLSTITTKYKIPIIQTNSPEETAMFFMNIVAKELCDGKENSYSPHSNKQSSLKAQQEYLVSSLPNIGVPLAKELLKSFGSIKNIANASEAELRRIELIGEKKAKQIKDVLWGEYL